MNHRGRSLCRRREPRGGPCLSPAQAQRAENCSTWVSKASFSFLQKTRFSNSCRLRTASIRFPTFGDIKGVPIPVTPIQTACSNSKPVAIGKRPRFDFYGIVEKTFILPDFEPLPIATGFELDDHLWRTERSRTFHSTIQTSGEQSQASQNSNVSVTVFFTKRLFYEAEASTETVGNRLL